MATQRQVENARRLEAQKLKHKEALENGTIVTKTEALVSLVAADNNGTASKKIMITKKDRAALTELGYNEEQISNLTPEAVGEIVANQIKA